MAGYLGFAVAFFVVLTVWKGVKIVPQQQAWVIERLGRYHMTLLPGLNILIPYIDNVAYRHSLKESVVGIPRQAAITKDNVTLELDGVLYYKITDPKQASYGVSDPIMALSQLAQTTMRSGIGKITLDRTFEEREALNIEIVRAINEASNVWGIQCLRYEIKDISPPHSVLQAMELQMAAERKKRADILSSEGQKQSHINVAEGEKQKVVLQSEAAFTDQVNRARGEAEAIIAVAKATANGIETVAEAIRKAGGADAVALRLAEQYITQFGQLAKQGTTIIIPADAANVSGMVAQALATFNAIKTKSVEGKQ